MPSPVTPDNVKTMLPSTSSSRCERVKRLFQFPLALYNLVSYLFKEDGTPTDEFKTDICALGCVGGGNNGGGPDPNPNMPAPTGVNATDGTYSDKIRVSWNAVTPPSGVDPVTEYDIYRSISTNTDPTEATLVGTVTAPTAIFDDPIDSDLAVGTIYRYWVRARNDDQTSAFSGHDVGSADAPTSDIDAVTDLRVTFGFGGSQVGIVWTPPSGATHYDVYRGTTGTYADATKIYSDVSPASTTSLAHPTNNPTFWDNVGEVLLIETPPSASQDYYYWVVAKKNSPPAVSLESNAALGRVNPPAIYNQSEIDLNYTNDSYTIPSGITKMWVVLYGGAGGGAGGNAVYGGGGGGAGGIVIEELTVAPGDVIDLITTGATPNTGNAPSSTDGTDGADMELQINTATVMTAGAGQGGQWNAAGGGVGGDAGVASGGAPYAMFDGKPGLAASGSSGGRSGYVFGGRRIPEANALTGWEGNGSAGGHPGSGAKAVSVSASLSVGGYGTPGRAYIKLGT